MTRCEIAPDFRNYFRLRASQLEWQRVQKFVEQRARSAVRLANADRCLGASRCDQHLHREEFGKNQMLAGGVKRFPVFWKMYRTNRVTSFPMNETARPQGFQRLIHNFIQQPVNDAAQPALGKTFRRWINRRDPSKMDSRVCGIILDNLELRV